MQEGHLRSRSNVGSGPTNPPACPDRSGSITSLRQTRKRSPAAPPAMHRSTTAVLVQLTLSSRSPPVLSDRLMLVSVSSPGRVYRQQPLPMLRSPLCAGAGGRRHRPRGWCPDGCRCLLRIVTATAGIASARPVLGIASAWYRAGQAAPGPSPSWPDSPRRIGGSCSCSRARATRR